MTIRIHDKKEIKATGIYNSNHCKPVLDITTGIIYSSVLDTANALEVAQSCVSHAIIHGTKCKGHQLCFVHNVMYHVDKIAEAIHAKNEKASKYDEILAEQERERLRVQKLAYLKAEQEKCEQEVANTMSRIESIMNEIKSLEGGN